MVYPDTFEQKLGFGKIRELLAGFCLGDLGRENVDNMLFSTSIGQVSEWLAQVEEMKRLELDGSKFPVELYFDPREALHRVRVEGLFMEEEELFNLLKSLRIIRDALQFIKSRDHGLFPRLNQLASGVRFYPMVIDRLEIVLNNHGKLKDNASPELSRLRGEITKQQQSVSRRMLSILKQVQAEGLVEADASISIRDGRAVIPVLASNKRKIKGIVHDESATGKTFYIEPAEIVEANNQIRELIYAERREVTRVLKEVTSFIRPYLPDLHHAYAFLGVIDFIKAKTRLANLLGGIIPGVRDEPSFSWLEARHPLLYLQNKPQGKPVVPMNLELNNNSRVVLISGPNAGGKSVCLQTVGLVQYMLQCGLAVPLREGSWAGMFEKIFLDMGDEQSIENDLSTYSSHLLNMKNFIRGCNNRSLVLIDEFGTGTEPMMGGAIAEAVLEHLVGLGASGIITTHYTNLKHYASRAPGVVNGAMLFDTGELKPLYKLEVGAPGSSFAFEIARQIGLPESILAAAKEQLGEDHVNFDKHLREIIRDKRYLEQKRQAIKAKEKKLDSITERAEREISQFNRERLEIIKAAKAEAARVLDGANKIIEATIREIKQSQANKERTNAARATLGNFKKEIGESLEHNTGHEGVALLNALAGRRAKADQEVNSHPPPNNPASTKGKGLAQPAVDTIEEGDLVKLQGQELPGEVMEVKGSEALVAFGQLITTVKVSRLKKISKGALKRERRVEGPVTIGLAERIREKKLKFSPGIDLRGMRADEAIERVIAHLDEAVMCGVNQVKILHGTGNGILRKYVRQHLKTIPFVKSFADEDVQLGGSGITVVEIE